MLPMLAFVPVISGVFGLITFVIWLWALIDAIQNPRLVGTEKIVWVLVIIFIPCIGALLYFLLGRKRT